MGQGVMFPSGIFIQVFPVITIKIHRGDEICKKTRTTTWKYDLGQCETENWKNEIQERLLVITANKQQFTRTVLNKD